jgi:hypothetical protein
MYITIFHHNQSKGPFCSVQKLLLRRLHTTSAVHIIDYDCPGGARE